ncbi:hypothetical protein JXA32_02550 [Candidatus Sumerlaeota bacterium]|nr:hypothetical protein [Candidatus Sumerlaeota bacterium]
MKPLKVALVHHHLRRGGVTRVIRNILKAIPNSDVVFCVLTGEAPTEDWPAPVAVVEGLRYAEETSQNWQDTLQAMRDAAHDVFGRLPDVWHIHNHSLGKNPAVTRAVRQLADDGERLLLHIHDFAEDGRPSNYQRMLRELGGGDAVQYGRITHPLAAHVVYALLNPRDDAFIAGAGANAENHALLPNAVELCEPEHRPEIRKGFYLYPTRAIRRKNIGEFLLWAALDQTGGRYAVTLAPENPKEHPLYERWTALAQELKLPVEFEAGLNTDLPFNEFMASAEAICTTSVQEGFGMAFLEPWLAGRPLAGRDLPEVTAQFGACGVDLSRMYRRLLVPLDWIDRGAFQRKLSEAYARFAEAYNRHADEDSVQRAMKAAMEGNRIDFARLDIASQEQIIRRAAANPSAARAMIDPVELFDSKIKDDLESQRRNVREHFNLRQYGERLMHIYLQLMNGTTSGQVRSLAAHRLLDQFMAPERFMLMLYE